MSFDAAAIAALRPDGLFSLDGRTAIVTGAGGGIGRWLAAGLGAAGARVLVSDVDEAALAEVCTVLESGGIECASVAVDLADDDAPARIVAAAVERLGGLDVLVNNAAVNRRMPILEMTPASYDLIMRIDLRLPYFLSQAAARVMGGAGGGAIVNISSVNDRFGLEHVSVYGAAKAGLSQLTRVMAVEWAPLGIRANAISPGFVDTPLAAPIWANEDVSRWLLNRVALKRAARPDELVGACLFLASDAASFVTGQTLVVDGGFVAGGRWFTPDE